MKNTISISLLALLIFPVRSWGQDAEKALPDAPSSQTAPKASADISEIDQWAVDRPHPILAGGGEGLWDP